MGKKGRHSHNFAAAQGPKEANITPDGLGDQRNAGISRVFTLSKKNLISRNVSHVKLA